MYAYFWNVFLSDTNTKNIKSYMLSQYDIIHNSYEKMSNLNFVGTNVAYLQLYYSNNISLLKISYDTLTI